MAEEIVATDDLAENETTHADPAHAVSSHGDGDPLSAEPDGPREGAEYFHVPPELTGLITRRKRLQARDSAVSGIKGTDH